MFKVNAHTAELLLSYFTLRGKGESKGKLSVSKQ